MNTNTIIYTTRKYDYLFEGRKSALEVKTFPDGEIYHRIRDEILEQHVVIIGGTVDDTETLELFDVACEAAKSGAKTLTLVIPYYGYSTMERAVDGKLEVVKAKTRAMLLSAIPKTTHNRVAFIDLHTEGIPQYLEGSIHVTHLYAKKEVAQMVDILAKRFGTDRNKLVLASTDAGRAKWVESLSNTMGVDSAFVTKRRVSGSDTKVTGVSADVKGRDVFIYDDMIRTGGSLIGAAKTYKDAGAKRVFAMATHAVLPGDSLDKLKKSGVIESVFVTNSHPRAVELFNMTSMLREVSFMNIISIEPLIEKYLESLGLLVDDVPVKGTKKTVA